MYILSLLLYVCIHRICVYEFCSGQKAAVKRYIHPQKPQDFAYKPMVSLEEGLHSFVLWFKEFYGSQVMGGKAVPRDWVRLTVM